MNTPPRPLGNDEHLNIGFYSEEFEFFAFDLQSCFQFSHFATGRYELIEKAGPLNSVGGQCVP